VSDPTAPTAASGPSGPAPEAVPPAGPLSLGTNAALVGGYRWIEQALFELLGTWVAEMPLPAVQVFLDGQSARHGWHAQLWADRLPVLAGVDPDGLTRPPEPARALLALLAGHPSDAGANGANGAEGAPQGALPRLAGLYRVVLPRLVVSYERHLAAASPVTDGPVIRALRLVLADEVEDWRAGERLVQRLVTRPHDVAAVHASQQRLESLVVNASVTTGLVRFPPGIGPN
jgi:hypothetical protein